MEDFFSSGPTLALLDGTFRHMKRYDELSDQWALNAFVHGAEQAAAAYARNYGHTVEVDSTLLPGASSSASSRRPSPEGRSTFGSDLVGLRTTWSFDATSLTWSRGPSLRSNEPPSMVSRTRPVGAGL
ncbi:MAG: hypothetical protein QOF53_2868 [Nocardioidaceae bacterium]|nr:hypothetical protein [Nocardioidaceae bacterium]